jgi:membrane protease subunit (stomatin/prohibitin family)
MIVKCINCETLWDKKTEEEKCCKNCTCKNQNECPNCGCNCYVPMNKKENVEVKNQILLFD